MCACVCACVSAFAYFTHTVSIFTWKAIVAPSVVVVEVMVVEVVEVVEVVVVVVVVLLVTAAISNNAVEWRAAKQSYLSHGITRTRCCRGPVV